MIRQYSKKELEQLGIQDRTNYETNLKLLKVLWGYSDDILIATSVGFAGSHDWANKFIEDMEAYDYADNPSGYWKEFCDNNGLEEYSNPF